MMELDKALEESMTGPFDIAGFAITHFHDMVRGNCELARATFMDGARICFRNENDAYASWQGGFCSVHLSGFDWEPLLDPDKQQQVTQTYYREFDVPVTGGCENDTTTSPV